MYPLTSCVDGEQEEQGVRMGGFERQLTKAEEDRLEALAEAEEAVFQMYATRVVNGLEVEPNAEVEGLGGGAPAKIADTGEDEPK